MTIWAFFMHLVPFPVGGLNITRESVMAFVIVDMVTILIIAVDLVS